MTEDKTSSPDLSQGMSSPWEKLSSAEVTSEGLGRIRSPQHRSGRGESSRQLSVSPRAPTRGGASKPTTPRAQQVMSPSAGAGHAAITPRSDGRSEGGRSLSERRVGAERSDGALRPSTPPPPPSRWLGGEDQQQVIEGMIRTMSEAVQDGNSITMQLMTKVSEQDSAVWSAVRVQAQAENLPQDARLKSECEAFQEEIVRRAHEAWNAAVSELGQAAREDEARREAREVQLRAELLQAWERLQARAQDTVHGEVRKAQMEVSRVRQEATEIANREQAIESQFNSLQETFRQRVKESESRSESEQKQLLEKLDREVGTARMLMHSEERAVSEAKSASESASRAELQMAQMRSVLTCEEESAREQAVLCKQFGEDCQALRAQLATEQETCRMLQESGGDAADVNRKLQERNLVLQTEMLNEQTAMEQEIQKLHAEARERESRKCCSCSTTCMSGRRFSLSPHRATSSPQQQVLSRARRSSVRPVTEGRPFPEERFPRCRIREELEA